MMNEQVTNNYIKEHHMVPGNGLRPTARFESRQHAVPLLVLWDIDGTLITAGLADTVLQRALTVVYGEPQHQPSYAGKTDQQIIFETYPNQLPALLTHNLLRFATAYLGLLAAQQPPLAPQHILGGARAVIRALADRAILQSVLTGNLALIAEWKLKQVGLTPALELACGAYGSDHWDRTQLVAIAAARAAAFSGMPIGGERIVVIGDTPADVACARAGGARVIAVATGAFSLAELTACNPDAAFPDLHDGAAVMQAIYGRADIEPV